MVVTSYHVRRRQTPNRLPPLYIFKLCKLFFHTAQSYTGNDVLGEDEVNNEDRHDRYNQTGINDTMVGTETLASHLLYEHRQRELRL